MEILPLEQAVRLRESLTVEEVAEELYGDPRLWRTLLFPLNRWILAGMADGDRLERNSVLRIVPNLLIEPLRSVVLRVLPLREAGLEAGHLPYISPAPDGVLVVGNAATYEVNWPNNWFTGDSADTRIEWWLENDKEATRRFLFVPERVQGPAGKIDDARTWKVPFGAPGAHVVHCRLTTPLGVRNELIYRQFVTTLDEKTKLAAAGQGEPTPFSSLIARERAIAKDHSVMWGEDQLEVFEKHLEKLEAAERVSKNTDLIPIRATYVSSAEQPISLPLDVFVGFDPTFSNRVDTTFHLKLWDFTYGAGEWEQTASGSDVDATMRELLKAFADDAPYPQGNIHFEVEAGYIRGSGRILSYSGTLSSQSLTYPTDGGTKGAAVIRGLGLGALVVGGVAGLAGQPEVAIPALWLSGVLAGAGAAVSLADRLEHGSFEWDVETGMDLLDIAGALVSHGLSSKVTATVRGIGSVTFTERLASGIGVVQLGVVGTEHLIHIGSALDSGDKQQVSSALGAALRDGALLLLVHRAHQRVKGLASATEDPGAARSGSIEREPSRLSADDTQEPQTPALKASPRKLPMPKSPRTNAEAQAWDLPKRKRIIVGGDPLVPALRPGLGLVAPLSSRVAGSPRQRSSEATSATPKSPAAASPKAPSKASTMGRGLLVALLIGIRRGTPSKVGGGRADVTASSKRVGGPESFVEAAVQGERSQGPSDVGPGKVSSPSSSEPAAVASLKADPALSQAAGSNRSASLQNADRARWLAVERVVDSLGLPREGSTAKDLRELMGELNADPDLVGEYLNTQQDDLPQAIQNLRDTHRKMQFPTVEASGSTESELAMNEEADGRAATLLAGNAARPLPDNVHVQLINLAETQPAAAEALRQLLEQADRTMQSRGPDFEYLVNVLIDEGEIPLLAHERGIPALAANESIPAAKGRDELDLKYSIRFGRRPDKGYAVESTLEGLSSSFLGDAKLGQLAWSLREDGEAFLVVPQLSPETFNQLAQLSGDAAAAGHGATIHVIVLAAEPL